MLHCLCYVATYYILVSCSTFWLFFHVLAASMSPYRLYLPTKTKTRLLISQKSGNASKSQLYMDDGYCFPLDDPNARLPHVFYV